MMYERNFCDHESKAGIDDIYLGADKINKTLTKNLCKVLKFVLNEETFSSQLETHSGLKKFKVRRFQKTSFF